MVAEDRRNPLTRVGHGPVRVDVVFFAEVSRQGNALPVDVAEVFRASAAVVADLELDPERRALDLRAAVARAIPPRAAAPGPLEPAEGLDRGDGAVGQLADEGVDALLDLHVVPVVAVLVFPKQGNQPVVVRLAFPGLDVALEPGISRAGIMPEDADGPSARGAAVAGAVRQDTGDRLHGFPPSGQIGFRFILCAGGGRVCRG